MDDGLEVPATRMDRRVFIRSGIAVGGLVWAAPAISSFGARAFAGTPEQRDLCPPIGNRSEQPRNLRWLYTGKGCAGTDSPQFDNIVGNFPYCRDVDPYPDGESGRTLKLLIIGIPGGRVTQEVKGLVPNETEFLSPVGGGRAGSNTYFEIQDEGGRTLHEVGFHTSCSEPLSVGDSFGSFRLVDGEEGQALAP